MWSVTKHALNRSLGSGYFEPLDIISKKVADDAYYKFMHDYCLLNNINTVHFSTYGETRLSAESLEATDLTTKIFVIAPTVKVIGGLAFQDFGALESVYIPNGVEELEGNAFFFGASTPISKIYIPSSVKTIATTSLLYDGFSDIYMGFNKGEVEDPDLNHWGATKANIHYADGTVDSPIMDLNGEAYEHR